jgi:hypothetical protein
MAMPWCFVAKIINSKYQITNKTQISNRFKVFGILNFGHCYLFVFWDLLFVVSVNQRNSNKANPLWG